jgi:protein translocase SecG subunit
MSTIVRLLPWIEIGVAALLIVAIIMQQSSASLGSAFGEAHAGAGFHTKRGAEKFLFILTIILAVLFAATGVVSLVLAH